MTHSTAPPTRTARPRTKTISFVAIPKSVNAPPSAKTIGQKEGAVVSVFASTASATESVSPSEVKIEKPAMSAALINKPNNAYAPRSEGLTRKQYKTADTRPRPVRPRKYFEPGVIISTYFCTYTKNHTAVNAAVRKYQYNAFAEMTCRSSSRPPTERKKATAVNAMPLTINANMVPVIA